MDIIDGILALLNWLWHIRDLWRDTKREWRENRRFSEGTWVCWLIIFATIILLSLIALA